MLDNLFDIAQIVFADIIMSGDNALIIGMAAAGLPPELRKNAIFWGMTMAAGFRVFFAVIASFLISIPGILFVGGLMLSWVCWRFFKEIRQSQVLRAFLEPTQRSPDIFLLQLASGNYGDLASKLEG